MARYYGKVGFGKSVETPEGSGVWKDVIQELPYFGNVIQDNRKLENSEGLNDNIVVQNRISILADTYAISNLYAIKYVEWQGVRWTVTTVEVQSPRLILSIGKVYNGPTE